MNHLLPGLFVFLWSTGFIGAKYGLPDAEPLTFLLTRYAIVIVLMSAVACFTRAPWETRPQVLLKLAASGTLVHGLYLGGVFFSISRGMPAGVVSLIVGMQPLLTAMLAPWLFGERISKQQWTGLALGLIGIGLVLSRKLGTDIPFIGLISATLALCGITFGTLVQKRYCPQFDWRTGTVMQFLGASAVTLPVAVLTEQFTIHWTAQFSFALAWLVLVLSLGAISLLNWLIRSGTAVNTASLFYLVPPCTVMIAWFLFDEQLTTMQLLGVGLSVVGVALARK